MPPCASRRRLCRSSHDGACGRSELVSVGHQRRRRARLRYRPAAAEGWGGAYPPGVKRVLLTGMSGTGKSSVVRELVARGYKAVDTDDGWCAPQPDGRQLWREDAIQALLAAEDAEVLFVAGCEENQAGFHSRFDHIVLLSAPLETLVERLATRTDNPYGKAPEELRRFLEDVETVEPRLRRVATHEVRTTPPLDEVVATILRLVDA
jgi:shikimate kinase